MQHLLLLPQLLQVLLSHHELPHLEHPHLPHLLPQNEYLLPHLQVELQVVIRSNENPLLLQLREIQSFPLLQLRLFLLPLPLLPPEETYHLHLLPQLCEATFPRLPLHLQREEQVILTFSRITLDCFLFLTDSFRTYFTVPPPPPPPPARGAPGTFCFLFYFTRIRF